MNRIHKPSDSYSLSALKLLILTYNINNEKQPSATFQ
jgi:hypothetical protein